VVFVAASQGGGKTAVSLNVAGYHIDDEPSPILVVTPTLDSAKAWSKDRLAQMIQKTPALRGKVRPARARDSDNTVLHKVFPGGHVTLVGANSAAGLAMRPIRVVIFDEVDRYPPSAGSEGDPVKLAEARTEAYLWNAVKFYASSPGDKRTSRLLDLWKKTDQQEWFVPCADCGHWQFLKWAQVQWEKDEEGEHQPETAVYVCERCGVTWDDVARWAASRAGQYRPRARFRGWRGFRLPGMAVLGRPLARMVEEWLDAQGNPEQLKTFVNTKLCEWWEDVSAEALDEHELMARREDWTPLLVNGATAPPGVLVLTLGVDVQADRLEYELVGWGRGEESWSLAYHQLPGDIRKDPNLLAELDRVLAEPWQIPSGHELYIRAACIDSGFATEEVYRWAKPRLRRRLPDGYSQFVFAVKGKAEPGRPVWPDRPGRGKKITAQVWTIGVDAAKDQVVARLALAGRDAEGRPVPGAGPGVCHFPAGRGQWFFEQITAEQPVTRYRMGRPYRTWELRGSGRRNEALDCRVYAYAAIAGLQAAPFLLDLEQEAARIQAPPTDPAPAQRRPPARAPSGPSWIDEREDWLRR